jgi:hypothetical protein
MSLTEINIKKIKVLRFVFFFILPVFILVVFLLTQGSMRSFLFRGLTKMPTILTHQIIRFKTKRREFSSANIWLIRQLNIVEDLSPGINTLLQGLIDNAQFVMARTRFPEDLESLQPFMQRFAETYPKLFLPRLWYAKSLSVNNYKEAFHQLEIASKLSPADERPYRIAFELALAGEESADKLDQWCDRYLESQFGGPDFHYTSRLFYATGLRKLSLQVTNDSGKRYLVANMGLHLGGELRSYDFPLKETVSISKMRLHFGILPGIAISIDRLRLYNEGRLLSEFEKNLKLISWNGFHLNDGRVITVSRDFETVNVYVQENKFGKADRVEVDLRFERLGLASPFPCGSISNSHVKTN